MDKNRSWYMAWKPGASGYTRDDIILAIGLKCGSSKPSFRDMLTWAGPPDRITGDTRLGRVAYFFDAQAETAAMFDIVSGHVTGFGTVARQDYTAQRVDKLTGKTSFINILDDMDVYREPTDSEGTEP